MYKKYLEIAVNELDNLKGFERANLALKIAEFMINHEALNVVPTKDDLEVKPDEFINLNPKADINKKIRENKNKEKAEHAEPEMQTVVLSEFPPEVKQVPVKKNDDEITEEWKNKILKREDYDRTWTPRMMANVDLANTFKKLGGFICVGLKKGAFDLAWINTEISRATGGHITQIDVSSKEKLFKSIPPAVTKLVYGHLVKAFKEKKTSAA